MRFTQFLVGLLSLIALSSATGAETMPPPGPFQQVPMRNALSFGTASLVERLRGLGVKVFVKGSEVEQPFFSITGRMIQVRDEDVQVFEYSSTEAANKEASPISADGMTVGTSKIHWIGNPHFFKKENLLVLYVGDNPKVLADLTRTLGPQFAGKK